MDNFTDEMEPTGYPADSKALREGFDKMLKSKEMRDNIKLAESALDHFGEYMKRHWKKK